MARRLAGNFYKIMQKKNYSNCQNFNKKETQTVQSRIVEGSKKWNEWN